MTGLYDYDGNPIAPEHWALLMQGRDSGLVRWQIGRTEINGYVVSTVWTGMDPLSPLSDGPPLIFETLAWRASGADGPVDSEVKQRYSTEEEAFEGHQEWVARAGAFAAVHSERDG